MVNQEIIKEFQEAIKKDYGKDVSFEDATTILTDLIEYFSTIRKVYSRMQADKVV